jgi:hypothetical protein
LSPWTSRGFICSVSISEHGLMWTAPGEIIVDEAILTALAEFPFPFSSVRELSRRICLPSSTVHGHRHLMQSLRFTVRHLRSVPHFLTGTETDSGPDGKRTIAGPLCAKHTPVARHCHLGSVVDLFIQ